eukprot:1159229-Pelagomonas_calceolata.AAC.7
MSFHFCPNPTQLTSWDISPPLYGQQNDVCGPMEGSLSTSKSYFVTLLDDYSGYSSIVPIATKGEACEAIANELLRWGNACE